MANDPYVLPPSSSEHSHTIIILHPRDVFAPAFASDTLDSQGSDGRTLKELFPTCKWVFPASNTGYCAVVDAQTPLWFKILIPPITEPRSFKLSGLPESTRQILDIIRREAALVPLDRIILGGVEQGFVTAMYAMLCGGVKIGGFVGFRSWLPNRTRIQQTAEEKGTNFMAEEIRNFLVHDPPLLDDLLLDYDPMSLEDLALEPSWQHPLTKMPVFLAHSKGDTVNAYDLGLATGVTLETIGFDVIWNEYEGEGHWLNGPQGVDDLAEFLRTKDTFWTDLVNLPA